MRSEIPQADFCRGQAWFCEVKYPPAADRREKNSVLRHAPPAMQCGFALQIQMQKIETSPWQA
ncbi:MAG: hypothetical protein DBY17_08840 [Oscillospiraceae bacterium]|nr:MAG: hypothetical protein DBY17_08840 [Oscillospiraceae bacterium]